MNMKPGLIRWIAAASLLPGHAGHAEAVRIRVNPAQVSYQQLLQVFFSVAHDPTQLNQFPAPYR